MKMHQKMGLLNAVSLSASATNLSAIKAGQLVAVGLQGMVPPC